MLINDTSILPEKMAMPKLFYVSIVCGLVRKANASVLNVVVDQKSNTAAIVTLSVFYNYCKTVFML